MSSVTECARDAEDKRVWNESFVEKNAAKQRLSVIYASGSQPPVRGPVPVRVNFPAGPPNILQFYISIAKCKMLKACPLIKEIKYPSLNWFSFSHVP